MRPIFKNKTKPTILTAAALFLLIGLQPLKAEEPQKLNGKAKSDYDLEKLLEKPEPEPEEQGQQQQQNERSSGLGTASLGIQSASAPQSQSQPQSQAEQQSGISSTLGLGSGYLQYQDIELATGKLRFSETDLIIPGKNGLDLKLTRDYDVSNFTVPSYKLPKGRSKFPWKRSFLLNNMHHLVKEGGGITVLDINNNGKKDIVEYRIVNGAHGVYRIGYDVDSTGKAKRWSNERAIPGQLSWSTEGGGVTHTDINQNGKPDLVFSYLDDPHGGNLSFFLVAMDVDATGKPAYWLEDKNPARKHLPYTERLKFTIPINLGSDSDGSGLASGDIDGNGVPELLVSYINDDIGLNDEKRGQVKSRLSYIIAWNINQGGYAEKWTHHVIEQDKEYFFGTGLAIGDVDSNNKLDLVVVYQNVQDQARIKYKIGWDLDRWGEVRQWSGELAPQLDYNNSVTHTPPMDKEDWNEYVEGREIGGVGVAVADLDGDGVQEMVTHIIDNNAQYARVRVGPVFHHGIGDQRWSGWLGGGGWKNSLSMRAFLIKQFPTGKKAIFIEGPRGIERYDYKDGKYNTKAPGNSAKPETLTVSGKASGIKITDSSGTSYYYQEKFFEESKEQVVGFYLSKIQDVLGNTITVHYQSYKSDNDIYGGLYRDIFTDEYKSYISFQDPGRHWYKRPIKVTDTFSRDIHIGYTKDPKKPWINPEMMTSITYKNHKGNNQVIKYEYSTEGRLKSVQVGDMSKKTYGYKEYIPNFHQFEYLDRNRKHNGRPAHTIFSRPGVFYYVTQPDGKRVLEDFERDRLNLMYERLIPGLMGHILEKRSFPSGASVKYEYAHSLSSKDYIASLMSSHPVVTKKTIIESPQKSHNYKFEYPKGRYGNPIKDRFQLSYYPDVDQYAFGKVQVKTPAEVQDETIIFKQGRIVEARKESVNGISAITKKTWDFNKGSLKTESNYLNDKLVSKQEILEVDEYLTPVKTRLTQGSRIALTEKKMSHQTNAAHLNNNLLKLVAEEKTTLTQGKDSEEEIAITTYTNEGLPSLVSMKKEGKTYPQTETTYDNFGRVLTRTLKNKVGGDYKTIFTYSYVPNASYTITKTHQGKTTTSIHDPYLSTLLTFTDINGATTRTEIMDDYGLEEKTTLPTGLSSTRKRSKDLKTITLMDNDRTVIQHLDSLGRVIRVQNPDGVDDQKTTYYFGDKPSKIETGKPGSWVIKKAHAYDKRLRVISETSPHWGTTYTAYQDGLEPVVTITDFEGRKQVSYKDRYGNIIKSSQYSPNKNTSKGAPGTRVTQKDVAYTYDFKGNRLTQEDSKLRWEWAYDTYNRVIKEYHPYNPQKSLNKSLKTQNTYAQDGSILTQVVHDQLGEKVKTITTTYDNESRPVQISIKDEKTNTTTHTKTTYDNAANAKGMLTKIESKDGISTFSYDRVGNVTQENNTIKTPGGNKTHQLKRTYNQKNQLTSLIYPDGKTQTYTYDTHNRLKTIHYDGKPIASYTYNQKGLPTLITQGNGITTAYDYQKDILITKSTIKATDGAKLFETTLEYDNSANITKETYTNIFDITAPERKLTYHYNNWGELIQVDDSGKSGYQKYAYDTEHNRTIFSNPKEPNIKSPNYRTDENSNRLIEQKIGAGRVTYSYDGEGNLTGEQHQNRLYNTPENPFKDVEMSYTDTGQIKHIKEKWATDLSHKTLVEYRYDAQRRKRYQYHPTKPNVHQQETLYIWDGDYIIAEATIDGEIHTRYIYSGNQKIAMVKATKYDPVYKNNREGKPAEHLYYFHNNLQGTPQFITDENQVSQQQIQMDSYGNVERFVGKWVDEINYTGKKYDHTTGLYYFNQRYYNPKIGRFLTEDPAKQYLNPYVYAANNPLVYVDPNGEWAWGAFAIAVVYSAFVSASINATNQYVITGTVNWDSVGQSALQGAVAGALSYGVGSLGQALKVYGGETLMFKTLAHAVSGGLQSSMFGGDFNSGFVGGAIGNISGHYSGTHMFTRTMAAGLSAGVSSALAGGDFWTGVLSGYSNQMFNYYFHEYRNWSMNQGRRAFKEVYMRNLATTRLGVLDAHYFRNIHNDPSQATILQPKSKSFYHLPHKKYISPSGHHESVLNSDGLQVEGTRRATYNYGNQKGLWGNLDHIVRDIIPHQILGP